MITESGKQLKQDSLDKKVVKDDDMIEMQVFNTSPKETEAIINNVDIKPELKPSEIQQKE